MRVRLEKKGIRVMGIAESFEKGSSSKAVLAGVVMRSDFIVDGVVFGECSVGGMDATDSVIEMYRGLEREDVAAIMLNGCIISWFNVIDLGRVNRETGLPTICVSYYPSKGIREYFIKYFPDDWGERVRVYESIGPRFEIVNRNGFKVYLRAVGIGEEDAARLVDRYTVFGRIPEPLRLARLLAHAALKYRLRGHG